MIRSLATALLLCLLAAITPAWGDVIIYHFALDSRTQPGMAPQFDPSLGTLREVDLSFDETFGGSAFVAAAGPFTGYASAVVGNVVTPRGLSLNPTPATLVMPFAPNTGNFQGTVAYTRQLTDPGQLSGFLGGSTVGIQIASSQPSYTITSGTVFGSPQTISYGSSGTGSLTYTYTAAVPEPSPLVLMVVGLACAAGWRWIRTKGDQHG
jgi:hypothetical protein